MYYVSLRLVMKGDWNGRHWLFFPMSWPSLAGPRGSVPIMSGLSYFLGGTSQGFAVLQNRALCLLSESRQHGECHRRSC